MEDIYHGARRQRDEARGPIPDPPSIAEARTREAEARENARKARDEAEQAEAGRDAVVALTPTGWRLAWWWVDGRLRQHRAVLAEAEANAKAAKQMAMSHAQVVAGAAFAVEVEMEQAARRRLTEVQRRRQVEAAAVIRMEQAAIAADLLRASPSKVALPIPDLLRQAEAIRRTNELARQTLEVNEPTHRMPGPGPR